MADWKTLHQFDYNEFSSGTIKCLKSDSEQIAQYYNQLIDFKLIDENERIKRISQIKKLANTLMIEFQIDPNFKTELINSQPDRMETIRCIDKFKTKYSDFLAMLKFLIFNNYSSFFPYFKLGSNLLNSCLDYSRTSKYVQNLIHQINYGKGLTGYVPSLGGIIVWLRNDEIKCIEEELNLIQPIQNFSGKTNGDRGNQRYTLDFKKFIQNTSQNNLGILSCINIDEQRWKKISNKKQVEFKLDEKLANLIYK